VGSASVGLPLELLLFEDGGGGMMGRAGLYCAFSIDAEGTFVASPAAAGSAVDCWNGVAVDDDCCC